MKKKIMAVLLAGAFTVASTGCGKASSREDGRNMEAHNGAIAEVTDAIEGYRYYEETVASADGEEGLASGEDFNTEEYNYIEENGFVKVADAPLSTFAADVDTGSYCNLRRLIRDGWSLDNVASSIRTEEMINYFD